MAELLHAVKPIPGLSGTPVRSAGRAGAPALHALRYRLLVFVEAFEEAIYVLF